MIALRKHRGDVYALIAYIVLAIALTYPLLLNLGTRVAGDGSDDPALAWNLWWVPYSIIHLGKSPIYTDYMFYPIGLNLAFYTLTYLNAFLSIPFQYAFNLVVATNVNLWLSFALSGFGAYLLVKYILRGARSAGRETELAAFVAGALYAFSSNKFLYASLGQYNIASSHWIPFYILFLLKLTDPSSSPRAPRVFLRYGFLLGLFLLFQALSEFIFASFLIIFTASYLVYWLARNRFRPPSFVLRLSALVVAALTFTIPMLPILAAMIQDMLTEGDFIQRGLGFADVFSSDVLGFFVPSHLNPIFGNLQAQFHFLYTNFAYLGFVALALAILAIIFVPRARSWGIFGAIFILISLGPTLLVNGAHYAPSVPMPFNLLLEIPLIKGNRYPSRWSVMVTLALAVLVGYAVAWASQKLKVKSKKFGLLLPFAFLLLTLFEHLSSPLPTSDFQIPDLYQTIEQDKGNFTVLEIPLAWRNGFRMTGTLDQAMMFAQWYQTEQQHPILGGNTSRNPELKFQYFTEAPVINSIIAVETGHTLDDATIQRDRELAPDVLRFFGIRYIVWHSPRDPQNRSALDAARAYVQYVLPVTQISQVDDDTGETVAFRVNDLPPLNQTMIRSNQTGFTASEIDPMARLNFAEGWGVVGEPMIWATRRQAKVFVRLDEPTDAKLAFNAFVPMTNQRVTVQVNGHIVGSLVMQKNWGEYSLPVARDVWQVGLNEIVFQFDTLVSISSLDWPTSIVAYSAGSEVGDFAHIFVNGVDAAQNLRGYNIVVINETTGVVEASEAFDTFASADESVRLVQFIDKIPNGRIIAIAVRDTAAGREDMAPNLTQEAVDALRSIGASIDLRNKFRWSYAVISAKGANDAVQRAFSVPESTDEIAPVHQVVGIGAMEPNVAAAIEWISVK